MTIRFTGDEPGAPSEVTAAEELYDEIAEEVRSVIRRIKAGEVDTKGTTQAARDMRQALLVGPDLLFQRVALQRVHAADLGQHACIELEAHDQEQSYASSAGMKLYKHDIDAKLPDADGDLTFKIAALSAPVMKTVAPARIILNANYDSVVGDNLPSACRVKVWLPVGTGLGPNASSKMSCIGAASATGGSTQQ